MSAEYDGSFRIHRSKIRTMFLLCCYYYYFFFYRFVLLSPRGPQTTKIFQILFSDLHNNNNNDNNTSLLYVCCFFFYGFTLFKIRYKKSKAFVRVMSYLPVICGLMFFSKKTRRLFGVFTPRPLIVQYVISIHLHLTV